MASSSPHRKAHRTSKRPNRWMLLQLLAVLGTLAAIIAAGVVVLLRH
jgi:hypothetical protein